jgi:hypothetical protein
MQRRGGIIAVQINGEVVEAKGSWTYALGRPVREAILGADAPHGFKETPSIGFIEGGISDRADLDVAALSTATGVTVTLTLANNKVIRLRDAYAAGDWNVTTEEGEIAARFEGKAQEIA